MSCGLTAVMSLLFHHTIRLDMIVTGFVCAVVIDRIINRITGQYRRKLALANAQLEERVRERTAELEGAHRMVSAGMLAAGVSHEIRSPLQTIMIAAEEIAEISGDVLKPETRAMLTDILTSADAINVILKDLNSIARPTDDPLGAIELATVVESASRLASYKLGPRIRLERGALDVPAVTGNVPRLVQLVLNLIANATRASRPDAQNVIRIDAESGSDSVVLAVSDTGCGMTSETRARIFEPYFTTGAGNGGTGLGLPICKQIVERMGGSIDVASTIGQGTTVYVTLRRAAAI